MSATSIDVYSPGRDITGRAATPVAASRFVAISGDAVSGVITVGHAVAGGRVAGVAKHTADPGELVGLARGNSRVVRVEGPDGTPRAQCGKAIPATTGKVVGYAITSAATGALAAISIA